MNSTMVLEAAARALIMGVVIFIALKALNIRQVRAQRIAWLLALAGALAMPLLVRFELGPKILPTWAGASAAPLPAPAQPVVVIEESPRPAARSPLPETASVPVRASASEVPQPATPREARRDPAAIAKDVAADVYLFVAATLTLRLMVGLVLSYRLRRQARRIRLPGYARHDIRVSAAVRSPVTVGASVLLPTRYVEWDARTRKIILSHEIAHVRQRDFLVQVVSGLHCALFWFSPFSWWLKRQLASLAEALSDHAAVLQAESRTGYAELLLAIAGTRGSGLPMLGVAMARSSNLGTRIDRLLSEQRFERDFATKRRLVYGGAAVALLALAAAASMARPSGADSGETVAASGNTPNALVFTDSDPPTPVPPARPATPNPATPATPKPPQVPKPPKAPRAMRVAAIDDVAQGDVTSKTYRHERSDDGREKHIMQIRSGGQVFMIGSGSPMDVKVAEGTRHIDGDWVYYEEDGRKYLVQDPQVLGRAHDMLEEIDKISRRQAELGQRQAKLGEEQAALSSRQVVAEVPTPDFAEDYAAMNKLLAELQASMKGKTVDLVHAQEKLASLQERLAGMEARLAEQETSLDDAHEGLNVDLEKLAEEQGRLGEEEGKLGEQSAHLSDKLHAKLRQMIDKGVRDGSLKPLMLQARPRPAGEDPV